MRLRLELTEICCWNPEDHVTADLFYLTGGAAVDDVSAPIVLSPMGMRRGQVRAAWPDQSVILDHDVPSRSLNLGMRAFEQDFANDWARIRDWALGLAAAVAGQVEAARSGDRPSDVINKETIAGIIRAAAKVTDFFASGDKDDVLGSYGATIHLGDAPVQHGEAQFRGSGLTGDWDYVVRFRCALPDAVPAGRAATYGSAVKLMHAGTTRVLHSHPLTYSHPGGSGQQQVTGFAGLDDNDWWRLRPAHGEAADSRAGQPVRHGDVLRLQHAATGRNLHSHPGFRSPVTSQQEVTCFGEAGVGDGNDDWRVEVEGGGTWETRKPVRFIHVATGCALHSHHGFSSARQTEGQQEVTAFPGRDGNDFWLLMEIA